MIEITFEMLKIDRNPIIRTNLSKKIDFTNKWFSILVGIDKQELIGKDWDFFINKNLTPKEYLQGIQNAMERYSNWRGFIIGERKESFFIAELNVSIMSRDGVPIGYNFLLSNPSEEDRKKILSNLNLNN